MLSASTKEKEKGMNRRRLLLSLLAGLLGGCGGGAPEFSPKEMKTIERLKTYIAKKDPKACKQICERFDQMHKKGQLNDEQHEYLKRICGLIEDWRWDKAKELADAIKPSQGAAGK